jgi:hypothetical protein
MFRVENNQAYAQTKGLTNSFKNKRIDPLPSFLGYGQGVQPSRHHSKRHTQNIVFEYASMFYNPNRQSSKPRLGTFK